MRRKTRWMALFMAAAMMMTGCGSSGSTESTDASADTASAAESVSTDTSSAGGTQSCPTSWKNTQGCMKILPMGN